MFYVSKKRKTSITCRYATSGKGSNSVGEDM